MRLALLDVGHGSCAVLQDGKVAVVVDCPPGRVLLEHLKRSGIALVSDLVISHADRDHCAGVPALLASGVEVHRIWINDDQTNRTLHYDALRAAFQAARTAGARRLRRDYPHSDTDPLVAGRARIEFLSPHHESRMAAGNRNRLSVTVRVVVDGRGLALLPGDLDAAGFDEIAGDPADLTARWLVAPHHGGLAGTPARTVALLRALLARTRAEHVFFSFARNGRFVLPRSELLDEAAASGAAVRCTQLSMHCSARPLGGTLPLQAVGHGAYAVPRNSCAGSVVIDVDDEVRWGGRRAHDEFVATVPGARCRAG